MRYFLDMNIPIYASFEIGNPLEKKARFFLLNKGKLTFLLCEYIVKENFPKWLRRQKAILLEFNQKVIRTDYVLGTSNQSQILIKRDILFLQKIIQSYQKSSEKQKFVENINQIFNLLDLRIKYFIENYIDEVVVPVPEIDFQLKSCLFTFLHPNDSDAKTIACAIQEHNNKELTIMTADKNDWTKELLEEVHNDIVLSKRYPKLPKIEYLQDVK